MSGYVADIENLTEINEYFREVVFTGTKMQLVVMCLKPGEELGTEVHTDTDQFFRFEEGEGEVVIDGEHHQVREGFAAIIPAGSQHNVVNTSKDTELKMYTIYAPPHHADGTIHATKAEADAAEAAEH